jgi:predicted GNAT superfamily acetyltransferase
VIEQGRRVVAFLLAFREGANYDSVNYQWFSRRYASFLYIDRIVVSPNARGSGAGALLYRRAFAHAVKSDVPWITCEFDVAPPNPASEAFHQKFGFRELGRQLVADGKKLVSLQAAVVSSAMCK